MNSTRSLRARRLIAAAGLAGLAIAASPAIVDAAGSGKRPALTINGTGTYEYRVYGDAAMRGTGTLERRGDRSKSVEVSAVIGPDDRTFPAPGECEGAISTISVWNGRQLDMNLIGYGEVCGHHVQAPTSNVTITFTGRYEVLDGPRKLVGTDGFFEIRLGADGSASAFAIDT